jgi:hypothetical protein
LRSNLGGSRRLPESIRRKGASTHCRPRLEPLEARSLLSTFTVLNTNDGGAGSLRQAILDANDTLSSPGLDTIAFNIPGDGVHTIRPLSHLPFITDPVVIDGYTQPGTSANTNRPDQGTNAVLLVQLDLDLADALLIYADNSVVRGLVINSAPNVNVIVGSFPGTIGGPHGGTGTVIEGNFIGTNPSGTAAAVAEVGGGVAVQADDVLIGGTTPASRNLISGIGDGVGIGASSAGSVPAGVRVQGNLIGTDATGTVGINQSTTAFTGTLGILVTGFGGGHLIGGPTPAMRNVISGFDVGIQIGQNGVILGQGDDRVQGNYVGLNVTGSAAIPNRIGVSTDSQQPNPLIGGPVAGEGNVISGNHQANVELSGGVVVQGNLIGPNAADNGPPTGRPAAPSFTIGIDVGGTNDTIGGTVAGAGNVIADNLAYGVFVDGINIENVAILGNSILAHDGLQGGASKRPINAPNSLLPRARTLWTNSKNPRYSGRLS